MRWCRFQVGNKVSYGLVEGNEVVQVAGSPFGRYRRTGARLPLGSVKLLVPCVPSTFYAAGVNYMDHVMGMAALTGRQAAPPPKADVGYRANNALIAHGEPIIIPRDATQEVQYEGELVVVIGKQAKHLREDEVWNYILGYTIGNDVSERTWQRGDRTLWRAKNADTFKPMGPWIETDADPALMRTTVRLNRRVVADFSTNNMIFGIATYLSVMTKYVTLYPGDVVWMGTDGIPQNMKAGDVVEVDISGIGTLRNPVAAEGA
ncbi:MAG: DUF2437 domain-containing protein [Dehalococcoidia bacterium]|nr:DUF2437 domain-containing protein [Dehalococcoidia bacterium]